MTISTRKTRVSTPYLDPSNGQTVWVPADVEVAIVRSAISRFAVDFAKVNPEIGKEVLEFAKQRIA